MPASFRITCLLVCTAALLVGGGCTTASKSAARSEWDGVRTNLSKEELGELLAQFQDTYEATVREAADRIVAQQPDRRTRRLLLLWQTRLTSLMHGALDRDDAVHGLLDAWALCLRAQHYFEDGDGRAMFGDHHGIAQEAAESSRASIEQIAALLLPPPALEQTRRAVDQLARNAPLRGEFAGRPVSAVAHAAAEQPNAEWNAITSLLKAPIAPFRAFEGIDRGAAAIQGFTAVAARMTDTVHDLPESARLQSQLLLMELEELEAIQKALASLTEFSQSAARLAAAAERLPEDLRREFTQAAEDLDERQARFQQTLHDAQALTNRVDETLARAGTTAATVSQTANHAAAAGEAWTQTFEALTEMVKSFRAPASSAETVSAPASSVPSAASPGNGFDIDDYARAAEAIDQAAVELQRLTFEIRALADAPELQASLRAAEQRAHAVVDHLAWRGAQLVLLAFVLLCAGQWLLRRRAGRDLSGTIRPA